MHGYDAERSRRHVRRRKSPPGPMFAHGVRQMRGRDDPGIRQTGIAAENGGDYSRESSHMRTSSVRERQRSRQAVSRNARAARLNGRAVEA